ncbi:M81 family metallopeptidase [Streptomyces sp. NBC_00654]|uniref:M81 family metallopeptidase n=1 Tax=Streptomyces sp. NBC_00654 TaxID=2975799 RepID=UPI00225BB60E|nr:M81 family metallopeptidase [Streptomyces sp. NBC_00654]MCX4967208.1 M81 family metallopeptidase [Streptomyces sp. NBC_00654]
MRIMVAGFQHETNTFSATPATYDSFVNGEGFPALRRGEALHELANVNIAMGGFLSATRAYDWDIVPVIWAAACPSGRVARDAYERITGEILDAAQAIRPDAIYLDLHGAMAAEHHDDGEGELLGRLRAVVGNDVPIVVSLDLHANVTERMMSTVDAAVGLRTYPHVDMAETGSRAAALLRRLCAGERLHLRWRRIPFLIPVNSGCTDMGPARDIYRSLGRGEGDGTILSFAAGFPATDFPECGPVVWGYGSDVDALRGRLDTLYEDIVRREADWQVSLLPPAVAVAEANRMADDATRPVVIADTQDNPGAGGDARSTGMLRTLAEARVSAVLAAVWDPAAAAAAHAAGTGRAIGITLGGYPGIPGAEPFEGMFVVEHLSDGRCRFEGPMMHGTEIDSGPSACLRIDDVRVGVTSRKVQLIDRSQLHMLGIRPERERIIVVKSSVHFRADFEPHAEAVLVAGAPGPIPANPADLPWRHLRPGMRTSPLGPTAP